MVEDDSVFGRKASKIEEAAVRIRWMKGQSDHKEVAVYGRAHAEYRASIPIRPTIYIQDHSHNIIEIYFRENSFVDFSLLSLSLCLLLEDHCKS